MKRLIVTASLLTLLTFVALPAHGATVSDVYRGASASIWAPDTAIAGQSFDLNVSGAITTGFLRAYAFGVYENAQWSYDPQHLAVVTGGTKLDGAPVVFGSSLARTYPLVRPSGTYTYTFVFGDRGAHLGYDVAVDVVVRVEEPGPILCDLDWRPPNHTVVEGGSILPLKFYATDCETGQPHLDPGVILEIADLSGSVVNTFLVAQNPSEGIHVSNWQYHYDWNTDGLPNGDYVVTARFTNGDELSRSVRIR